MIKTKTILKTAISFSSLVSFSGFSQTELKKKTIQKESNKEVLLNILDQLNKEHNENYSITLDLAKKRNWKKRYTDILGDFYELKQFTNDGYPLIRYSEMVFSSCRSKREVI